MSPTESPRSKVWRADVEIATRGYYEFLKEQYKDYREYLEYQEEGIEKVFLWYEENYYKKLYEIIEKPGTNVPDRHKVLAAYAMSFLVEDNYFIRFNSEKFYKDHPKEIGENNLPFALICSVEIYISCFIQTFLLYYIKSQNVNNYKNSIRDYNIEFPDYVLNPNKNSDEPRGNYADNFFKLLALIGKDLNSKDNPKHIASISQILMMANILFLIEAVNDCGRFGLSDNYFANTK
jgi:hypothetical protein